MQMQQRRRCGCFEAGPLVVVVAQVVLVVLVVVAELVAVVVLVPGALKRPATLTLPVAAPRWPHTRCHWP